MKTSSCSMKKCIQILETLNYPKIKTKPRGRSKSQKRKRMTISLCFELLK